jgi:hypothetical protein
MQWLHFTLSARVGGDECQAGAVNAAQHFAKSEIEST